MRPKADRSHEESPFQNPLIIGVWEPFAKYVSRLKPRSGAGFDWSARFLRVTYLTLGDFNRDRCPIRSAALTYITVLSLVPLLAFAFALAKGFGAYDQLYTHTILPFVYRTFPVESPDLTGLRGAVLRVFDFVRETDMSKLGWFGLAVLLFTVLRLLGAVEGTFNDIWGAARSRTFMRKLADYLAMVVVTTIFLVTATGITTAAASKEFVDWANLRLNAGPLLDLVLAGAPYFAMWVAFTFAYKILPNTTVRWRSAALGGVIAGSLWQILQVVHVEFQLGVAAYNKLYAGFAALPLFLVWVYGSWLIVLLGCEIAWAYQVEPGFRFALKGEEDEPAFRELVTQRALVRLARGYLAGRPPATTSELAQSLGVTPAVIETCFARLAAAGILASSQEQEDERWLFTRDPELVTLDDLRRSILGQAGERLSKSSDPGDRLLTRLEDKLALERAGSAANRNLRDIAQEAEREAQRGLTEEAGAGRAVTP